MLDLNLERTSWAKELWDIELHKGQLDFIQNNNDFRFLTCKRGWGKSTLIAVDVTTWALMYPISQQIISCGSDHLNKIMYDNIQKFLQIAQQNHLSKQRFPFLNDLEFKH